MAGETAALAERVRAVSSEKIGEAVRAAARAQILDTVGALVYGRCLPRISDILEHWLTGSRGGETPVLGLGGRASVAAAAGAASALAHAGEIDSIHGASAVCMGAAIVPPVLTLARQRNVSGGACVAAVIAGYEAAGRLGRALGGQGQFAQGRWPTALAAPVGVAAAAGRLLELSGRQIEQAMGSAAMGTGGLLAIGRNEPETRHLLLAGAVRAGIEAALAVEAGFVGPQAMLEGEGGLCGALCDDPDMAALASDKARFQIEETGVKPYGCGRQTQAAVRTLIDLMGEAGIGARDIERIDVVLPTAAAFFDRPDPPDSRMAAVCSVQFTLALAAHEPEFLPLDFEARRGDPDILALAGRVGCTIDAPFGATYPGQWPARICLRLKDGRRLEGLRESAPGDPGDPLPPEALRAKFDRLTIPLLGAEQAAALAAAIERIEDLASIASIVSPLTETREPSP